MGFSQEEIDFIKTQPLARIATVDDDGQPDVVAVGFQYDGTYFNIGGLQPANTRRHRNVQAGHNKVALVIDDLAPGQEWSPRFLRVYGRPLGKYPYSYSSRSGLTIRRAPNGTLVRVLDGLRVRRRLCWSVKRRLVGSSWNTASS